MKPAEISLKNKTAVLREVKTIANYHLSEEIAAAKACILQGMFSRTILIQMKTEAQ